MPEPAQNSIAAIIDKLLLAAIDFFENKIDSRLFLGFPGHWRMFNQLFTINQSASEGKRNLQHLYNLLSKLNLSKNTGISTAIIASAAHGFAQDLRLPSLGFLNYIGLKNVIQEIAQEFDAINFELYLDIPEVTETLDNIQNRTTRIVDIFFQQINANHKITNNKTTRFLSKLLKRTPKDIESIAYLLKGETRKALSILASWELIKLIEDIIKNTNTIEADLFLKPNLIAQQFIDALVKLKEISFDEETERKKSLLPAPKSYRQRLFSTYEENHLLDNIAERLKDLKRVLKQHEKKTDEASISAARITSIKIEVLIKMQDAITSNDITIIEEALLAPENKDWAIKTGLFASKTYALAQETFALLKPNKSNTNPINQDTLSTLLPEQTI